MKLIHVAVILGFIYLFNGISEANYELEHPSDPKTLEFQETTERVKALNCQMTGNCD